MSAGSLVLGGYSWETEKGEHVDVYAQIHAYTYYTAYLEILAVIKFGDLPEIWQKYIIGEI